MAVKGWRLNFVFAALQLLVVTAEVFDLMGRSPPQQSFTKLIQDFVAEYQRQYASNVANCENEVAAFLDTFSKQVDVIEMDTQLIAGKYREVDHRLTPLEMLSDLNSRCMKQYRPEMDLGTSVRTALANCATSARSSVSDSVANAVWSITQLRNYYSKTLKNALADCDKQSPCPSANNTLCITKIIAEADKYTLNNRHYFDKFLHQANNYADTLIRTAVDCRFKVLYNVVAEIAGATRLIKNCIAGEEGLPSQQGNTNDVTRCKNVITLRWSATAFREENIENPFFGMDSHMKCIRVNFER